MDTIEFELWENPIGKCPVQEFMDELEKDTSEMLQEKLCDFEKLPRFELYKKEKLKKIEAGMVSVRIHLRKVYFRFLGAVRGGRVVLVHAIKKKTDVLPQKDIETARNRIKQIP